MKKLAVFGNPIAHSLSPSIHHMFAQSCGETISYEKIECAKGNFAQALTAFFADPEAIGCNITVPFKQEAFELTQSNCDRYAMQARAVNTLLQADILRGFNTDGLGLVSDLVAQIGSLQGASVLLIGAGGAARGVIKPLLDTGVSELHISNRTFEKAKRLSDALGISQVKAMTGDELASQQYDIIVNCTSASLTGELPELGTLKIGQSQLAYDMVYGKQATPFMRHALSNGAAKVSDGLGMLIGQAAEAFYIWTGKRPAITEVQAALRDI
ncbi:shikimate dehydrogenase [Alteromonas ponticola]|uniref:Shikimate dehydrogenase (NADP(+)) n=1 Tax=Alteromonas aquimaris TaxID=2998417 RepID=A0ABT3P7T9_9ALTE|nr:shikimate dehydrogenase [Alteromonas aquimaris]MCW8108838.1 shikimate dehydrogenase [Alteromonas aquimaris]